MRRFITVLVVILVLVLAGGLVLSAIPRVQAAASRAQCQNNLKQIGLALHNYHDNYRTFPSATVPSENLPCGKRLSWQVDAIPFMTQIGHLLVNREKAWDAEENYPPRVRFDDLEDRWEERTVVKLEPEFLRCPSNAANAAPGPVSLTDYIGNSGVGPDAAELDLGYPGVGFFGCERRTKNEDIKDGLANTVVVMETNSVNGPWTAGGFPTTRGLDPGGRSYLGASGQFSSGHSSGAWLSPSSTVTNVVYADGSVRGLTESVSPWVLEALVTIAGGEEIGPVGD